MKKLVLFLTAIALLQSCKKTNDEATYSVDTTTEAAQQVGDVTASIDESGGSSSGAISTNEFEASKKAYARLSGENVNQARISNYLLPEAQAAACGDTTFDACTITNSTGKRTRDFGGCTLGSSGGTMTGNVVLTFSNTTCAFTANGNSVSRVPNFSITGLRGATFNVAATGTLGQTLSRTSSGVYSFTNEGIRRTFTTPKNATILDVTTSVTSAITINGSSRASRTMTGGSLLVKNNLTNDTCTLVPNAVTWSTGCNCPTSGSFSGTCSVTGNTFTVTFGSTCGSVTVDNTGETQKTVTLDRCGT